MHIAETFFSLQGEGPRAGTACFFVRTAGCNLECRWCDTRWADSETGRVLSPADIAHLCAGAFRGRRLPSRPLVCVTGGEPMLQSDLPELLSLLVDDGFDVDLMTNGTVTLDKVPPQISIVVDLKVHLLEAGWIPPFADSPGAVRPGPGDAVKFVVGGRRDFDIARECAVSLDLFGRAGYVFVSPSWGVLRPADLASWVLDLEPRFRLGLQLHKFIWGADTRM